VIWFKIVHSINSVYSEWKVNRKSINIGNGRVEVRRNVRYVKEDLISIINVKNVELCFVKNVDKMTELQSVFDIGIKSWFKLRYKILIIIKYIDQWRLECYC